jgi:hypothetical protein
MAYLTWDWSPRFIREYLKGVREGWTLLELCDGNGCVPSCPHCIAFAKRRER